MRGPSEEQCRQMPTNMNQNHHHNNNIHSHVPQQAPQQHSQQETANFNENNRSFHSNGYQQNGSSGYNSNNQTSPVDVNPFAEYAWMADADEFDRQVMEQMEQEEYLEACFQQMWDEEENDGEWFIPPQGDAVRNQSNVESLDKLTLNESQAPIMLNPNAAEFIPRQTVVHQ